MAHPDPTRQPWLPGTAEEYEEVLEALREILASSQFRNSKRYPALLRYVVEQTLEGNGDQIKERTVGVEVFGRAPDYDTNLDTIVRYSAGEVRKRLTLYYHQNTGSPIVISLSAGSYRPDFLRSVNDPQATIPNHADVVVSANKLQAVPAERSRRRWSAWGVTAAIFGALLWAFLAVSNKGRTDPLGPFWGPMLQSQEPTIISLGGVVFSPASIKGTAVAEDTTQINPYLSFENGLAMGRVAALLHARGAEYRVQPSSSTTLAQIRENPTVLVGAYNNDWTQRLLNPLRFHFDAHPDEAIVDSQDPQRTWRRDNSKAYGDTPDYAIVARFHNPSTDSVVVVLAGIQRFGTDAASQFVTSPDLLADFNRKVGHNWRDKNLEVVLKVDVVNGRAGAPTLEAFDLW